MSYIKIPVVGEQPLSDFKKMIRKEEYQDDSREMYFSVYINTGYINNWVYKCHLKEGDVDFSDLTIESFLKNMIRLEEQKNSGFQRYKANDILFDNCELTQKRIINKAYENFYKLLEKVYNYNILKKDPYYTFRQTLGNKTHFEPVANAFISLFKKYSEKEVFKAEVQKYLDSFKLQKGAPLLECVEKGEIYILKKDISIETIIESGSFPKVQTYYFQGVKHKSGNEYSYIFTEEKELYEDHIGNHCPIFINSYIDSIAYPDKDSKKMVNASFQSKKDVLLFFCKKEAENYYRNEILKIQRKINKVLNEEVVL